MRIGLLMISMCSVLLLAQDSDLRLEHDEEAWQELIEGRNYVEANDESFEFDPDIEEPDLSWPWEGFLQVVLLVLVSGLVIFLLIRILSNPGNRRLGRSKVIIESLDEMEVHIQEIDLNSMLEQALKLNDHRLALRIRYLMLLRDLDGVGWIRHHKDKTNGSYQREMQDKPLASDFRGITRLFERVWYGEYGFGLREYEHAALRFQKMNESIPSQDG